MKQFITLLSLFGVVMLMASCRNQPAVPIATNAGNATAASVAEFAEFAAWKQQKEQALLQQSQPVKEAPVKVVYVPQKTTVIHKPSPAVQTVPAAETTAQPVAKKRWSKAAKGAVIGAGAGAVAGAIIGKKNRVLGAVIGGVAGGGVGYGIGRGLDKKDGR